MLQVQLSFCYTLLVGTTLQLSCHSRASFGATRRFITIMIKKQIYFSSANVLAYDWLTYNLGRFVNLLPLCRLTQPEPNYVATNKGTIFATMV